MKVKRLFSALGLGLFAFASAGVGALSLVSKKAESVSAETASKNVTQYVSVAEASDWWTGGADSLNIWMFGGDGDHPDKFVSTQHLGGDLYKFTFEAGYSQFLVEKAAGETHWVGQSYDITFSADYNTYNLYKKGGETKYSYDRYWTCDHNGGSTRTYYLDVQDQSSYWSSDSAKTYIYYVGNGVDKKEMTRIGSSNVYFVTINDYYVFKFLFVRALNFDPSNWDSTVWNQTKDILYTSTNYNNRWVKLGAADPDDNNKLNVSGFETITVGSFADAYAVEFLNTELCLDAGGLKEDFSTKWTKLENDVNELKTKCYSVTHSELISGYFATASSSGDSKVAQAMKRYDAILSKNPDAGISNFLSRALVPASGARFNLSKTNTNGTGLVIIISVVSLSAASCIVLILAKKRKHQ